MRSLTPGDGARLGTEPESSWFCFSGLRPRFSARRRRATSSELRIDHLRDEPQPARLEIVRLVDQHRAILRARNLPSLHRLYHRLDERREVSLAFRLRIGRVVEPELIAARLVCTPSRI